MGKARSNMCLGGLLYDELVLVVDSTAMIVCDVVVSSCLLEVDLGGG